MEKIGLIAGNRKFPLIFAQGAKRSGNYIVCVAIKKETSAGLKKYVDEIHWIALQEFNRMFSIFRESGVKKIVMAGQISPVRLFSKEVKNNRQIQELLASIKDRKANTIFSAIAKILEEQGLQLIDSTTFLQESVPAKGTLTRREPSLGEWEDIGFGLELARKIAGLDIGLTVAVKNKAIVAVEALEGTDNLIKRAGKIARQGLVIVKVARPDQDMRFDIPVIGFDTVKNLIKVKATCLVFEAGKTLFIDMQPAIKLAQKKGLAIVAV
jgi:hypothetical protein